MSPEPLQPESRVDPQSISLRIINMISSKRIIRTSYGWSILLLLTLGVLLLSGAVVLPPLRELLISIAATSLFASLLLYAVTPERFLTANLTQSLHNTNMENIASIVDSLDLEGDPKYIATDTATQLLIPGKPVTETPECDIPESTIIRDERTSGLVLTPTGYGLLEEFERQGGTVPQNQTAVLDALASAVVDEFGLADEVMIRDLGDDHATIHIIGCVFDDETDIDHPIQSFFAVGLAGAMSTTITPTLSKGNTSGELLISLYWGRECQS